MAELIGFSIGFVIAVITLLVIGLNKGKDWKFWK